MNRYAAKLLFQYRVVHKGVSNRRRVCEERVVTCAAPNARAALTTFKKMAQSGQQSYLNATGGRVRVEFVGIMEMIRLFVPDRSLVWYDMVERLVPMERKAELIPSVSDLNALFWERNATERVGHFKQNYRPASISRGRR